MTDTTQTPPAGQAVAVKPPPLETGGMLAPIIPRTVDEMFRLATAFHRSGLVPATLDSVEKVMVAILAGAELGMAPNQSVQAFYVVNNRPTLWGDAIPALLWANGFKLREWFEGEGDDLTAHCEVTRPAGDVIPGEFSMADAKAADLLGKRGPWQTARKRMLKMRARAFAARDGAADVLKGMQIKEEAEDYGGPIDNGPTRGPRAGGTGLAARLAASGSAGASAGFSEAHVAQETAKASRQSAAEEIGDDIPDQFTGADADVVDHDPVTGEVFDAEFEESDDTGDADDNRPAREEGDAPAQQTLAGLDLKTGADVAKTQSAGKTIAEQVAAFKAECVGKTAVQLAGMWKRAAAFRTAMDARDPEGLAEFVQWFDSLLAEVDDAERAAR